MAKIVMYWDCEYSPNKKIPGYIRECPGCEHPRSKNVVFYHSNPPHVATAKEITLMGKPDPNWYCDSCLCGNLQKDKKCWQCGDSRKANSAVQPVRTAYKKDSLVYSTEEAKEKEKTATHIAQKPYVPDEDPYDPQTSDKPVKKTTPVLSKSRSEVSDYGTSVSETVSSFINEDTLPAIKKVGAGLVALITMFVVGVMIYNFFFKTHVETVQVTAMPWSQSVRIEEYQTFHEQGWTVPTENPGYNSAGRQTDVAIRKSGDLKVHDGWTTETVPDTCYKDVQVSDTCTGYHDVSDTCTGSEYVSDTCYQDDGNGGSESYDCGSYESYTYSCTKSESYTYPCTKTESQPYACTKVIDVEIYHYEDIMSPWYWYDIERWTTIGTYPTSGDGVEVFYDAVLPNGSNQRRIEEGGTYFVTFSSTDEESKVKPFTNQYDLEGFKYFYLGQIHEVDVNYVGQVLELR